MTFSRPQPSTCNGNYISSCTDVLSSSPPISSPFTCRGRICEYCIPNEDGTAFRSSKKNRCTCPTIGEGEGVSICNANTHLLLEDH